MTSNIYELRRYGIIIFMIVSLAVVVVFLSYSDTLVKDLSRQERNRMQIWADATREIVKSANEIESSSSNSSMDFLLSIIEGNSNIPVLLTDSEGTILMHRNFSLPESVDSLSPLEISDRNLEFLRNKLADMRETSNIIEINMGQPVSLLRGFPITKGSQLLSLHTDSCSCHIHSNSILCSLIHSTGRTEQSVDRTVERDSPSAWHTDILSHGMDGAT